MLMLTGYEDSSVVGVGRLRPVFYVMCYVMQDSGSRVRLSTSWTSARACLHWNKNALVTRNPYKRNNQLLARSVDLLSTSAARKKNRPFYLGKSPHSGEEKFQPQQPCPTIIPVSVGACWVGALSERAHRVIHPRAPMAAVACGCDESVAIAALLHALCACVHSM